MSSVCACLFLGRLGCSVSVRIDIMLMYHLYLVLYAGSCVVYLLVIVQAVVLAVVSLGSGLSMGIGPRFMGTS